MLDNNLLGLIVKNAEEMPEEVAIREKRYGIWSPLTWRGFQQKIERFALGIRTLGFEPGDKVAIIGDNKPEWIIAEFGTIAAGGIATGMYADCLPEEMLYLITYSDARFLVLRDQEQVDKILKVWDQIKEAVVKVVVWDSRGMAHYYEEYPFLTKFEKVLESGAAEAQEKANPLREIAERIDPCTPALMLTTSGTTAKPKLSVLSHENLIYASRN